MAARHPATADADAPVTGRLNPFAFPSDTGSRFTLLLIFAVATEAMLWTQLAHGMTGLQIGVNPCWLGWESVGAMLADPALQRTMTRCGASFNRMVPAAMAAGLMLLTAGTLATWWFHPHLIGWRKRLSRFDPREAPVLAAALDDLVRAAALRQPPGFFWNPLGAPPLALAYGRAGRYRVALNGAMAVRAYTDPEAFRATMLHELAHIANGDVDRTWLALGAWRSLLVTGSLPLVAMTIWRGTSLPFVLSSIVVFTTVTMLVTLTLNAMLRARELYADTRASTWLGASTGLARALAELRGIGRWGRLASAHPDPARRIALLRETDALFRAGFWDLFGLGLATSLGGWIVAAAASAATTLAAPDSWVPSLVLMLAPALLFAPFAAIAAGTIMWRASFLALLRGGCGARAGRGGLALGLGVLAGGALWAAGNLPFWLDNGPDVPRVVLAAIALWALFGFLPAACFLKWVEAVSLAWLPAALGRERAGPWFRIAALLCCVVALPWFALSGPIAIVVIVLPQMVPGSALASAFILTTALPVSLAAAAAAIAIWGFPLAAGWVRTCAAPVAAWAFLDAPDLPLPCPPIPVRPGRAVLVGVAAGLTAGLALRWLSIPLGKDELAQVGFEQFAPITPLLSMVLTAILVQALVSMITVPLVPALAPVHAMFAAFVAGNLLSLAAAAHMAFMGGGVRIFALSLRTCYGAIVMGGGAAALVAVVPVWATVTTARRLRLCMGSFEPS